MGRSGNHICVFKWGIALLAQEKNPKNHGNDCLQILDCRKAFHSLKLGAINSQLNGMSIDGRILFKMYTSDKKNSRHSLQQESFGEPVQRRYQKYGPYQPLSKHRTYQQFL